jgi:hypothetical protein
MCASLIAAHNACSVRHGRQTNLPGLPTVIRDRADWCVLCEARERPESEPNRSALVCPRTAYCIEEREEGLRSDGLILALTWPPPGRWTNTRRAASVSERAETTVTSGQPWEVRTTSDLGARRLTRCVKRLSEQPVSSRAVVARSAPGGPPNGRARALTSG